jgi:AAA+ superfamily predicted ATPase
VEEFSKKFYTLLDAGAGVIQVRTHEVVRAALEIRKLGIADGFAVREWDIVNGFRDYDEHTHSSVIGQGDGNIGVSDAFAAPLAQLREKSQQAIKRYYVYVNFHPFMDDPGIQQLVTLYNYALPASNTPVILVTPDIPLTVENETVLSIHFDPPGFKELRHTLETVVEQVKEDFEDGIDLDEEDISRICYVGAGMTRNAFGMYASLAVVEAGRQGRTSISADEIATGVALGKTEVVNQSEVLELYPPTDINNVGGLDNLKEWVAKRKGCYSDEAREFGIEPPKGIVLVGVPGTGKSLVAKAVASEFGIPLVRLDFGRVFNSLVGASENRMRQALRQVENMAPVVLFADEIDKGLGGIGSGGDSGVSSRVLGSFLTWLQDCKKPVFVMVTANNVNGLPPEMLRRGRFDAIFSTTLPSAHERREVLRIHLKLRDRDIDDFDQDEVNALIQKLEGYVPAEIESAVKDALVDAFSSGEDLTIAHISEAVGVMVPLSKAFKEQIAKMAEWAENNATPASKPHAEDNLQSNSLSGRNIRRRRRE